MDQRQLQYFLQAVRVGNLTEAAAELGVSQPALSKGIKALETTLGVRLLERGRFGVMPTRFGEALLTRGRVIEAEMRHARAELDAMKGARTGHVLMGCGPTEANRLLPLALKRLQRTHPQLRVTALYGLNETLMPWVKQGEIDFALSSVPQRATDADLMHEALFEESGVVVARAEHPLARKREVGWAELAGAQWVLPRQHELERRAIDELFVGQGLEPPEALVETTSTVLMKSMVMQSDCLTFIPRELIYWEALAGTLIALKVTAPRWQRLVGVTRRKRGSVSAAGKALIDALKEVAKKF
jgi:DNA-binding transcriptional LysR family regulator